MRILLVWSSADWSIADVARGYDNALRRLGHDVRVYPLNQWIAFFSDLNWGEIDTIPKQIAVLQLASEKAVVDALRHEAEWVLIISGMGFHPDGCALLNRAGFKTALLCTESPYNDEQEAYLAQFVDVLTVNDRTSLTAIKHPRVHYMPQAYDPAIHHPGQVPEEYKSDVVFVGTGFAERKELFESVNWAGINLRLFGYWVSTSPFSPLFPFITPRTMPNEEAARWYKVAKVGLNLHRDGVGYSANPRVFELAACGTHQIVDDRRAEVHDLFGDSVCYFHDTYDFEERIRACLEDEGHRQIASRRALECVKEHTFENRAQSLLGWLGEVNNGYITR